MSETLSEEYKELFHYTTAVGLEGIIRTQTLRATHYRYVNDRDEFQTFFKGRLSELIHQCADAYINQFQNAGEGVDLDDVENIARAAEKELLNAYTLASTAIYEPYLLSFCGVSADKDFAINDGLLSQWRAYGQDGGYAIVFDTELLEQRFSKECRGYHYLFTQFGCVDYYDPSNKFIPARPERLRHEAEVKKGIGYYFTSDEKQTSDTYNALLAISCSQKHIGFHEENEVRIAAAPTGKKLVNMLPKGDGRKIVDWDFRVHNGVLVPYITLFKDEGLPIKRIIVGPHPDRERRVHSVERLLLKYDVDVKVIASDIPYSGI